MFIINLTELATYFNQVFSELISNNFLLWLVIWHINVKKRVIFNLMSAFFFKLQGEPIEIYKFVQ